MVPFIDLGRGGAEVGLGCDRAALPTTDNTPLEHSYIMFVFSHICAVFRIYTPQSLYNTVVGVQADSRVSYPIHVVSG